MPGRGETTLTITAPENIAGVTARILEGETALEYDGMQVETGPLDDSGMSPVDAVPVLMDYVQEGFIAECGMEARGRARCCVWSAGSRSPPRARGGSAPSGLTRPPTPFCGGRLSQDGFTVIQCVFTEFQFTVGENT